MSAFNYDGFTKDICIAAKLSIMNDEFGDGDYVGCIRIGDLCFDIVARSEIKTFCFDLYIGGIDDGYGYKNGYPYTYYDGFCMTYDQILRLSYKGFKRYVEKEMMEVIKFANDEYKTLDKANQKLHVW